ncbi:Predicted dehydrogenase [Caldanaerobius fijiensis DSM 17918]|uniref:Predicted dehydrogenase n=1 Tax=Caldanaerobius fijiensis DSM 17918 TaxID=1121256 RepID=A0A1M4X850_9THEO|nr:Gfo/Idh/MocA family oxidoreductase [Caldanaerobius fijiensis]SHE89678.1 Predicted dehydrogenase [Caldanaerobius fijiensis DSM 17918]
MADKLRVGIIGVGGIANGKHMPNYAKLDNVEMVAFCDLIEERAAEGAKRYGTPDAKVFTDYRRLLEMKDVDAVSVCTTNDAHAEISIAAMEAGKHVLCEKPMAKDAEGARKMLETARRTGMKLSIGYQNRFRPETQYLKKLIENGELGEIYYARAIALRRRGVPTWGQFLSMEKQGGGPLIDIATHALDMTLWLMDNYKPVSVTGAAFHKLGKMKNAANIWGPWDPDKFEVEDSAFGFVKFENGAVVSVESSWALNMVTKGESDNSCILCGTKAGAEILEGLTLNGEKFGELYTWQPSLKRLPDRSYLEIKEWVDHITNDGPLTVKPEQAYVVSVILDAIYQSSRTGKEVYVNVDI